MHLRDAVQSQRSGNGEHQAGVSNGPGKWPQGDQGLQPGVDGSCGTSPNVG
jgi:hypothetical protein